jgi:hypothetical protein
LKDHVMSEAKKSSVMFVSLRLRPSHTSGSGRFPAQQGMSSSNGRAIDAAAQ